MTSKEALKCLEPFRWDDKEEIKAYEVLEELVDRDTPKKVYSTDYHYCPNCDTQYLTQYQRFCDWCGQRLDWSKE